MGVKMSLGVIKVSSLKQLPLKPSKLRQLDLRLPILGAELLRMANTGFSLRGPHGPFDLTVLEQTQLEHRATGHTARNSPALVIAELVAWPAAAPDGQGTQNQLEWARSTLHEELGRSWDSPHPPCRECS